MVAQGVKHPSEVRFVRKRRDMRHVRNVGKQSIIFNACRYSSCTCTCTTADVRLGEIKTGILIVKRCGSCAAVGGNDAGTSTCPVRKEREPDRFNCLMELLVP